MSVGANAFAYCSGCLSVEIKNGVQVIGPNAFFKCTALVDITIPKSVMGIGADALYNTNNKLVVHCGEGSVAYKYATDHNYQIDIIVPTETSVDQTPETPAAAANTAAPSDSKEKNQITASSMTITASDKPQTKTIKATCLGGAQLSYRTEKEGVTIDNNGKLSIPANFTGLIPVEISSSETEQYAATTHAVYVVVKRAEGSITNLDSGHLFTQGPYTETLKLQPKTGYDTTFSYVSSDPQVATVSEDGVVTIDRSHAGEAIVTVMASKTMVYR